jgi:HPt (histidine-containing phosphotransfer) domain-containing protein
LAAVTVLDPETTASLTGSLPPALFARVIDSFEDDLATLAAAIEAGLLAGDRAAVHGAAHGLAGAAAAIGATELERLVRQGLGTAPCPPDFAAAVRDAGSIALRQLRALQPGGGAG